MSQSDRPGLLHRDCPLQASPIRPVAGQSVSSAPFGAGFPVQFLEEAMMYIHTAVPVSIGLRVTVRAPEQLAPSHSDALAVLVGEPLPQLAAARAILAGAMGIDFDRHRARKKRLLTGILVDLAAQLIGLPAVHAPRLAAYFGLDFAQALKQQHAAGIPGAHPCNVAGDLAGGILIHAPHVAPELLVAVLALGWLAREPLLFGDALEMPIALLIEAVIGDKDCFNDVLMLPDRDHRQVFHIEIDRHCHQLRIELALLHLFGLDLFGLREVQRGYLLGEDQGGALPLPGRITQPLLEVAAAHHRELTHCQACPS